MLFCVFGSEVKLPFFTKQQVHLPSSSPLYLYLNPSAKCK